MDWRMVENASDAGHRIQTLVYLFRFRYETDAETAGFNLKNEERDNKLCRQVINEIREEIAAPSVNLEMGTLLDETEIRRYLSDLLQAFDRAADN